MILWFISFLIASLNIEIFNYSWTIVNDYDVLIMMPDDDDEIFHYSEMVTVCSSWTESQGACTTWCPAHSSPDRRGRSSWTSVVQGLSPWHRYSSVTGWWGWGYRRSSETRDKKDCFSWIYVVQMRSGHYVPDTVVDIGEGEGSVKQRQQGLYLLDIYGAPGPR